VILSCSPTDAVACADVANVNEAMLATTATIAEGTRERLRNQTPGPILRSSASGLEVFTGAV
jgi:hypothetical protein